MALATSQPPSDADPAARVDQLRHEIEQHNYTYFVLDSPTVTDVAGVPYDKITSVRDVRHLAQIDDQNVLLVMGKNGGASALQTIALP